MKKILSMVLALVMLLFAVALTSCSKPEKKLEKAELVFEEASYTTKIKTTFSSTDSELNAILAAKNTEVPVVYDNDVLSFGNPASAMKIDIANNTVGTISPATFIVYDHVLYLPAGLLKNETDVQGMLANSDKRKLFDTFNARIPVDNSLFADYEVEKDGKSRIYNFAELSEDGKIELKYALRRNLIGVYDEYSLELTDYKYSITLSDKKIQKIELSYTHNISVNGSVIPVTVTMVEEYNYENVPKITEPSGYYEKISSLDDYY